MNLMAQLRARNVGMRFGWTKFFEPNTSFIEFMRANYPKTLIYDVGAGAGHVTKALTDAGLRVIGIDMHVHSEQEGKLLIADATTFPYPQGSVVMVCRPCHGEFFDEVVLQAVERKVATVLYVGLARNVGQDLGDLPFKEITKHVGDEDESIWRMNLAESKSVEEKVAA